jgi:hypothetical protein
MLSDQELVAHVWKHILVLKKELQKNAIVIQHTGHTF